jgi:uncharacterized protein (DUF58 family)
MHPGSRPGPGEDFFQHRPLAAGEDVRAVDWRASARLGHLVVKERHRPLRQPLVLLLDLSDSMAFPRAGPTKGLRARQLGAALTLLALRRGDPASLELLGPGGFAPTARVLPAGSAAGAAEVLLSRPTAGGRADVGRALASLSPDGLAGKHAVLLSDLYGDTDALEQGLKRLIRAGAAVSVLQILDQADRHLPPAARAVRDAETGETLGADTGEAQALTARVDAWERALEARATRAGAEWVSVDAAAEPGVALRAWLGGRG